MYNEEMHDLYGSRNTTSRAITRIQHVTRIGDSPFSQDYQNVSWQPWRIWYDNIWGAANKQRLEYGPEKHGPRQWPADDSG